MILVYDVYDTVNNRSKEYFLDSSSLISLEEDSIIKELASMGVNTTYSEYVLNLGKTLKEAVLPSSFTDSDILDLAKLYYKGNKIAIDAVRFNILLSKSQNKKMRKAGEEILKNADLNLDRISFFKMPKYAKELFKRIDKTDSNSTKSILETFMNILTLKKNTDKNIKKMISYPKKLYYMVLAVFIIFMMYVVPDIKAAVVSMNIKDISGFSKYLYDMTDYASSNPMVFSVYVFLTGFLVFKTLFFITSKIVARVPYIYKIGFFRDHALFFGLLSTFQQAGLESILAFNSSVEVISNAENREKMKKIINDMLLYSEDFLTGLEKQDYDKSVIEYITANKGLTEAETYAELRDFYSENMTERVEAASELVKPAGLILIVVMLMIMLYGIFSPIISIVTKAGAI